MFDPHYRTTEPSVYVQDDWRATSWLTVNAGVRYDVFTPLTEEQNNLSNIDMSTLKLLVAGQNGVSESAGVKTDYSNIAPRFGAAATLPSRVVVRGGWGVSYFPGNYMSQSLLKNPPFVSTYGTVTSTGVSGLQPNLFLSDGLPLPVPTDAVNLAGTIIGVEQDFKSTRVQQFNVVAEKEFGGNVFSAGYVGSRATRVAFVIPNLDLAPAAPGNPQPRRTYAAQLPNVTTIGMFASDFDATYDALQLVFQRRHLNGLTVSSNYTLAHTVWTSPTPNDVNVIERFDADFDVRHRIVFSANYELPFGRSFTGVMKTVLAGWQATALRVANRLAVHGDQCGHPKQHHRGQRSAQRGRRHDARRSQHRPMVQRRSVFGAAGQHHRQRRPQHPSRPAATRPGRLVFQRLCAVGDVATSDSRGVL